MKRYEPLYDYDFANYWGGSHARNRRTFDGALNIELQRVDSGGYVDGRYFGVGAPLYAVSDDTGEVWFHIRAKDRAEVKRLVRTGYPNAKIGR